MSQIRPKILLTYGRINQPIRVPPDDLTFNAPKTFLTENVAVGTTTLAVKNVAGLNVPFGAFTTLFALIGDPKAGGTELLQIDSISTGFIQLVVATEFTHSASTLVRVVQYDEVELSNALTENGSKVVIDTVALTVNQDATEYYDDTNDEGYFFARFHNSVDNIFSTYSDAAPVDGYTLLSARSVIDAALDEINKVTSAVLTDNYAFRQLDACQTECLREQKRWMFMQEFNAKVGTAVEGTWRVAVPTDLDDKYTNKSTWHFRIGKQSDMTFVDKTKWDDLTSFIAWTTLAAEFASGATEIELTDSDDFDDGGSLQIGGITVAYTANNRSTGVLTLEAEYTGDTFAAGTDVFEGASLGEPTYWTIFGGYYWMYPVISSNFNGRGLYSDYYKKQVRITKDSDNLVIPDDTVAMYYLEWKMLRKQNNGKETEESKAARDLYIARREKMKQKDSIGRTFRLKPLKNSLNERNFPGNDPKWVRDGNFPNI